MSEEYESKEGLLLPLEVLLPYGIQIGTRIKTGHMKPFIFKVRPDGLCVLDIAKTCERIKLAATFLARFEPPEKIVVASTKLYARMPVLKFCELTHATPLVGRFLPGIFTNPSLKGYIEPEVLLVSDPNADEQAVREASMIGIPVVALCDTDNLFKNVDLVIPVNNKGRRALAMVFWLLAREFLRVKGVIPKDGDLPIKPEDFEAKVEESAI
jgi:small subunit ribosomal protein S2